MKFGDHQEVKADLQGIYSVSLKALIVLTVIRSTFFLSQNKYPHSDVRKPHACRLPLGSLFAAAEHNETIDKADSGIQNFNTLHKMLQ